LGHLNKEAAAAAECVDAARRAASRGGDGDALLPHDIVRRVAGDIVCRLAPWSDGVLAANAAVAAVDAVDAGAVRDAVSAASWAVAGILGQPIVGGDSHDRLTKAVLAAAVTAVEEGCEDDRAHVGMVVLAVASALFHDAVAEAQEKAAVGRDKLIAWCRARSACFAALDWLATFPASATLVDVWEACDRGDWLLWFASRVGVDRRLVVEAACDCAETALAYVPPSEERPARAIAVARAWARGEATADEVRAAADDAKRASEAAAAHATHDRVDDIAAARAAYAAACAAYAVVDDADAARAFYAASHAADAAAVYTTRVASVHARHASLVRDRITAADVAAEFAGAKVADNDRA
jgi:hypothetical protein